MMKINILPLAVYLAALIALVYLTGISEEILIVFPVGILMAVVWFVIPCFVAVLTALLSKYKLWWRAIYAFIASTAITLILPLAKRRILIYERFDSYASLRGFWSLIQERLDFYSRCFWILFFVFWIVEEITYGCKREWENNKEIQG